MFQYCKWLASQKRQLVAAFLFLSASGILSLSWPAGSPRSALLEAPFGQMASLQAQIGLDFNRGDSSGTVNLVTSFRLYHNVGGIVPAMQNSLHINANGFFWFVHNLSARFMLGVGLPVVVGPGGDGPVPDLKEQALVFYDGEFALRFTLLKVNRIALMLGVVLDASEGHTGNALLFNVQAQNQYLQTSLGAELELALALSLEYLFYARLKVPLSSYSAVAGSNLDWGFYPRQGSIEIGFLFHKGPSFGLSKAARNIYFGLFYRFDARILNLTAPNFIFSHTLGFTYYVKPPF